MEQKQKHENWLNIYLPFFVRFSKITAHDPKYKNHEYFKVAIKDLEEEYTKKTITVLSVFRDVLKEHVKGRKHPKVWYLNHALEMNLIPQRDEPFFWLTDHCPKFLTHLDKINQILDDLEIEKVEPFEPVPPKKTRADLKTEHGRKLYDLINKWAVQIGSTAPNEAMELLMVQHDLLKNENELFTDDGKPKYKFDWRISWCIDEDPEIKKIYFEEAPLSSSEDESEDKENKE